METKSKQEEKPLRIDGSGIVFEEGVPGHVRSALKRLHQNLGHPRTPDLVRHLRLSGCESAVIKATKGMKCQVCDSARDPQVARPSTMPRMLTFEEIVAADILYAHDCNDKRHVFLSLVDVGATYRVVIKLRNTSGKEVEQAFNTHWVTPFGAPHAVSLDLETGLQDGFSRLCSWRNVKIRNSATQAHFQSGVGERQVKWWKHIWARVCKELSIEADEAQLAATLVSGAKNSLRRRCGHSPSAWIFGREGRAIEDVLDPDSGGRVTFDISDDARFQRQAAIRASARIAFHKSENDAKLRKALLQRARAVTRPFENCRLTAPEHLRPSGPDETGEFLAMNGVKRELEQLLQTDFDDDEAYRSEEGDEANGIDDIGSLYSPSVNPAEDEEMIEEHHGDEEEPLKGDHDEEGDVVFEPTYDDAAGNNQNLTDTREDEKRGWPLSRMKRKTPPEDVDWKGPDSFLSYSVMMMRRHLTRWGLEKRQEKELRWDEIPQQFQQKFRRGEAMERAFALRCPGAPR